MTEPNQVSAGFILYKENGERQYLLLHHGGNYWNFPKGKLEKGEDLMEAAKRELREETGITEIELQPEFMRTTRYSFLRCGRSISKEAVFFLAECFSDVVEISREHAGHKWLSFDDALEKLKFQNAKDAITDAESFIKGE